MTNNRTGRPSNNRADLRAGTAIPTIEQSQKAGRPSNIEADPPADHKAELAEDDRMPRTGSVRGPPLWPRKWPVSEMPAEGGQIDYLLTERQVARRLGGEEEPFSLSTLRRWRSMPGGNGLKFVKIGFRVRYRTSDVEAFIARCEVA
jgi:hypothetical protein